MKTLFITASGTEAGKTFVTSLLIRQLRAKGKTVRALKPLVTGFTDATAHDSDTRHLLDALGLPATMENIASVSPWRFEAPLAPNMAAQREGQQIELADIINFCRTASDGAHDVLLIEGVGGVMVPLNDQFTVRDWIKGLEMPALLVAGSYLGSISHTLTALEALQTKAIAVAGVVVSESVDSTVPLDETVAVIERFAGGRCIKSLPRQTALGMGPDITYLIDESV